MAHRITNMSMIDNYNRNLNQNLRKMENYQRQISTGRKIVRLSDDPVNVVKVVNAKDRLLDVEQYGKNLNDAGAWLNASETALNDLNSIVARCYELSVYAANDIFGADEKQAMVYELSQLREHVITLANSTLGDKYIFGGYNVTYEPFAAELDADDVPTGEVLVNREPMVYGDGDEEFISFELGMGLLFEVGVSANAFLGVEEEGNIYYQITKLIETLSNESSNSDSTDPTDPGDLAIRPFVGIMQQLQKNVLAVLSDVGGRSARIEMMVNRYSRDFVNYSQMQSDVEDLDYAEGMMYFSMAESVYRSALSIGGRVLQPTLLDFLN